jgi:hypothetical protein
MSFTQSTFITHKFSSIKILSNYDNYIAESLKKLYNLRKEIQRFILLKNIDDRNRLTKDYLKLRSDIILYVVTNNNNINSDLLKLANDLLYD